MPETAFPNVKFPGLPKNGDWCLARVDKTVAGKGEFTSLGNEYKCGKTAKDLTLRGKVKCNLTLHAGRQGCDETDFISNDSKLVAEGEIIRRGDRFALFGGEFVITVPDDKKLFSGRIELLFRVGSHLSEPCDEVSHVEGWLVGQGFISKSVPLSLRATMAGKFLAPGPRNLSTTVDAVLCGIVVRPK